MDSVLVSLEEEIALEGLDGITLDSLWFRLSERLKIPLPFYDCFKEKLWKIIVKRDCYELFIIAQPRKTVNRLDRIGFINGDPEAIEQVKEFFSIYSWSPVDDPETRGSCAEFNTRHKLNRNELEDETVADVYESFGQALVIVASQKLRNKVLIPPNVGRDVDINNHAYCLLERIGRSRHFGEAMSGPYSIMNFVKDSKITHYFRQCILRNNLAMKQHYISKSGKKTVSCQLFHLPRFFFIVQSTQLRHTEVLFSHLLLKDNNIATLDEVRNVLQLGSKTTVSSIRSRPDVFEYRKFLYSEVFPNSTHEESTFKKGKDRKVTAVKLMDPNFDIIELYKDEDKEKDKEKDQIEDEHGFLNTSRQHIRRPLAHQVYEKIEESKSEGISQSDIAAYFGLSRLNARSVIRKITRSSEITSFLKDEGRQRVTMFISKKHLSARNKEFVDQVAKILKSSDEVAQKLQEKAAAAAVSCDTPEVTAENVELLPSPVIIKKEKKAKSSVINIIENPCSSPSSPAQQAPPEETVFAVPDPPAQMNQCETIVVMPDDECSFVDNIENVKVTLRFLNNIPGVQKNFTGLQKSIAENKVSQKVLSRMSIILDVIKERTVIDLVNLLNILRQREANFTEICCRKSMLTLCGRLAADNLIKVIQMELISATNVIKLIFFGEPTVTFDMRCWNSIIEEQKIQHFVTVPLPQLIDKVETPAVGETCSNLSVISQASVVCGEFDAQSTRHENFPKFMKYRLFHEYLYYLIYNYPADVEKIPVKRAIETWRRNNQRLTDCNEIAERISTCYTTDIGWKMFIPPLNQHLEYKDGWGLLRDIIHRIPLILFVKFTRYAKETTDLDEYIMHPIKCNYLLHFLPSKLRTKLFNGRKFIAAVVELCKRLCWLGLLQFGPSRTKEIDQAYVYLNRKAMLLDTRSSEVGYMEVSEKEYPKQSFYFDSFDAITNYWTSMFDICINTKINKKNTAIGKTIILEQLSAKPPLIEALKPQTPESAPLNDNGEIPGDRKGAGGLDKGFMSHLKQSWSRTIDKKKRPISALAVDKISKKVVKREKTEANKKRKRVVKPKSISSTAAASKGGAASTSTPKIAKVPSSQGVASKSKIIRKVKARKQTVKELKKRSELYDEVDKEALRVMKTLRVTWSDLEDKTLLLAKVAMKFAFPMEAQRSHYISCAVIRDILHWRTDRALNKTSKACQRRIAYLMKNNKQFVVQVFLYLEELRANADFVNKYSNFAERLKKIYNQEQIYIAVKVHLVEMIFRMHQIFLKEYLDPSASSLKKEALLQLPRDYDEFMQRFRVVNPKAMIADYKYGEPQSSAEIEVSMLASLIHGAVCSANDKVSNSFFLLETYKKFSDDNLGAAVSQLRQLMVISMNKNQRARDKLVMPYSISPFHLSNRYASQLMGVHVPVELYDEYLAAIRILSTSANQSSQLKTINCGWIFMLAELLSAKKVAMASSVPALPDAPTRKKSTFEKFSENYLINKRNKEQQKNANKSKRMFRLPVDNNSDEKFIFNDDPLEIFFKLDSRYLHIFCILQSIEHQQRNDMEKWSIQEKDEDDEERCTLKHCIIRAGASFSIEIQKIACHCFKIIKSILDDEEPGPSKYDESAITKYNLVKFFDNFIEKCAEKRKAAMKKDMGRANLSEFHHKVSTKFLLHAIQRLSTEVDIEDGAWLSEYKKISHKNDDDIFEDEEDMDVTTKSINQLKDLNTSSRSQEMFSVNLSNIIIESKEDRNKEMCAFEGESFGKGLLPFAEQEKTRMLNEIKNKHVWMPADLARKSFEEDIASMTVSLVDRDLMEDVCQFLKSQQQNGAAINQILDRFGDSGKMRLHKLIDMLVTHKVALRAGVNEIRFVHRDYAAFWLVDTFYLTPKEPHVHEPPAKKTKIDDTLSRVPSNHDVVPMEIETFAEPAPVKDAGERTPEEKKNLVRNSYYLLPAPWIRVGPLARTLNRRCLDKWLGSLLNHISINPGIALSEICLKFNIITPVHVLYLCETLDLIGCIKLMAFSQLDISIFSDYDSNEEEVTPATHLSTFEQIFVETTTDAFQRLTFFIGRKKYKLPFV